MDTLAHHLQGVRQLHQQDLAQGYGSVYLPFALERKYSRAEREWTWQYVFPADRRSISHRSPPFRPHQRSVSLLFSIAAPRSIATPQGHSFKDFPLGLRVDLIALPLGCACRSPRMRSNNTAAGSSLGSWEVRPERLWIGSLL